MNNPNADEECTSAVVSAAALLAATAESFLSTNDVRIATREIPFGFSTMRQYVKTRNVPSLTNWRVMKNKSFNGCLTIEMWKADRAGTSVGRGVTSGAKSIAPQAFSRERINVAEIYFDDEVDSWVCKSKEGTFYRIAWANAYRNDNFPHHKSRKEVNDIITSCNNLKMW